MNDNEIAGYTYGTAAVAKSPVSQEDFNLLKKPPSRLAVAHLHRNRGLLHWGGIRAEAVRFLEVSDPVKKPGPGERADPAVVAFCMTPFRKVI